MLFGRKKRAPANGEDKTQKREASMPGDQKSDGSQTPPVNLSMSQVLHLAIAAFRARGFPNTGLDFMGSQIVWLEERKLPGLMALTAEFTVISKGVPWNIRGPKPNPDKQLVFDCPFVAGTMLSDQMEQLVVEDPEDIKGIMGPSSPVLFLPRIAGHAAKIGEPIEFFFKDGEPLRFEGRGVTDGDQITLDIPSLNTLLFAKGMSFRRFNQKMPEHAWGASRSEISFDSSWMLSLAEFIARDETDARPDK